MMFDTSIIIDVLRNLNKNPDIQNIPRGSISVITVMEILRGEPEEKRRKIYEFLITAYRILPIDENVIFEYARLYSELKRKGKLMGDLDLIIAATAKAYNEKLRTKDKDFLNLSGLVDVEIAP